MQQLAFLGTGPCDPNKDMKVLLTGVALVIGWLILIFIIRKINQTNKSSLFKIALTILIVSIATLSTLAAILGTSIGLACSG